MEKFKWDLDAELLFFIEKIFVLSIFFFFEKDESIFSGTCHHQFFSRLSRLEDSCGRAAAVLLQLNSTVWTALYEFGVKITHLGESIASYRESQQLVSIGLDRVSLGLTSLQDLMKVRTQKVLFFFSLILFIETISSGCGFNKWASQVPQPYEPIFLTIFIILSFVFSHSNSFKGYWFNFFESKNVI